MSLAKLSHKSDLCWGRLGRETAGERGRGGGERKGERKRERMASLFVAPPRFTASHCGLSAMPMPERAVTVRQVPLPLQLPMPRSGTLASSGVDFSKPIAARVVTVVLRMVPISKTDAAVVFKYDGNRFKVQQMIIWWQYAPMKR